MMMEKFLLEIRKLDRCRRSCWKNSSLGKWFVSVKSTTRAGGTPGVETNGEEEVDLGVDCRVGTGENRLVWRRESTPYEAVPKKRMGLAWLVVKRPNSVCADGCASTRRFRCELSASVSVQVTFRVSYQLAFSCRVSARIPPRTNTVWPKFEQQQLCR